MLSASSASVSAPGWPSRPGLEVTRRGWATGVHVADALLYDPALGLALAKTVVLVDLRTLDKSWHGSSSPGQESGNERPPNPTTVGSGDLGDRWRLGRRSVTPPGTQAREMCLRYGLPRARCRSSGWRLRLRVQPYLRHAAASRRSGDKSGVLGPLPYRRGAGVWKPHRTECRSAGVARATVQMWGRRQCRTAPNPRFRR